MRCDKCGRQVGHRLYPREIDNEKMEICMECLKIIDGEIIKKEKSENLTSKKNKTPNFPNKKVTGLRVSGVIASILCFIAGINMATISSAGDTTIMQAYYNAMGWFVLGLTFFIGPLLWGLARLIEKDE